MEGRGFGGEAQALEDGAHDRGVGEQCDEASGFSASIDLSSGFQADDLLLLNAMQTTPRPYKRGYGVWSAPFDRYEGMQAIWWKDPDARGAFFRPLPSLVIEGSLALFGPHAFPLHLLGVLLHGAVGFTVFWLFRRLTGSIGIPALAAFVFLTCEDHSMGVGWIATITDIICVLFVNLALLAHLSFRRSGGPGWLALSLGSLALAFGSKETAVAAPLAVVLLEFLLPETGPAPAGRPDWPGWRACLGRGRDRWRRWIPAAVLLVVYVAFYRAAGFGVNSLVYHDPAVRPLAYLQNVVLGLPVLILAAATPVPPSLILFLPSSLVWLAGAGLVAAAGLAWCLRFPMREPVTAFSAAGFGVALLPQLAAVPSERLLYLPMVFGGYVVARLVAEVRPLARRFWPERGEPGPHPARIGGWILVAGMIVPGVALSLALPPYYAHSLDQPRREVRTAVDLVRKRRPNRVVVLNTSGMFMTLYVADPLQRFTGLRIPVAVLSSTNARVSLTRLDRRSFVLRVDRPGWFGNFFAALVRTNTGIDRDRSYRCRGFTAQILELTPDGRDVRAVRFEFTEPLDSRGNLLLSWNGKRYVELAYHEWTDGESRLLADTSDLWASMGG